MISEKLKEELKRILEMDELPQEDYSIRENVDSLARTEILIAVEEELGVELNNAEMLSVLTFGDLLKLIEAKQNG